MGSWTDPTGRYTGKGGKGFVLFGKMSGGKAVLIVGFIAALLYYLIVIRRLGRRR